MSKEQAILEKSLGKLLGTEDGTSDFFHHLVTIESKDVSKDATDPNGGSTHIWGAIGSQPFSCTVGSFGVLDSASGRDHARSF